MRWQKDEVDIWCEQWANQRRMILGIASLEPRERLGKLRSTLGAVREEGEGASQGTVTQQFPEVYTGTALLVHRAWTQMNRDWRAVVNIHYVLREIKVRVKAEEVGITVALYWKHLDYGKNFVQSFVTLSTQFQGKFDSVMETQKTLVNA